MGYPQAVLWAAGKGLNPAGAAVP